MSKEGKQVQVNVWIPAALRQRLKVAAARAGESMTAIVVAALDAYLRQRER